VKRRIYIWGSLLALIVLGWLGHKAWLAHQNLVTLNVHDADVRDVLRKCEWQTWEVIVVHKAVKGKVTLNVVKVPLEEVLGIIAEQTETRITAVYPIFSKKSSFVNLRKLARGDIYRDTAGWTNFSMIAGAGADDGGGGRGGPGGGGGGRGGGPGGPGGFGGGGGFGGAFGGGSIMAQNSPITLTLSAKDLDFAALALARRANAQVVPEDGASGIVTLSLKQVPFREAVAKVASETHRKSDVFYSVQAQPEFAGFGRGDDGPGGREGRRFGRDDDDTNRLARAEARAEEFASLRQRETDARLATMTPEEQAKALEEQKKFEEMRNLPPEERRQAFEQMMNNPQRQQQFENRRVNFLNNSSPEQRSDRTRAMMERRARGGGRNGGGGGGGGGRRTQ
jgi:hypothetical protein